MVRVGGAEGLEDDAHVLPPAPSDFIDMWRMSPVGFASGRAVDAGDHDQRRFASLTCPKQPSTSIVVRLILSAQQTHCACIVYHIPQIDQVSGSASFILGYHW
jgi:hypothetical protein